MDEREAWQPKIFYSTGPQEGLPEPFPAPTHLRRKERSSYNRGALFVPGLSGGGGGGGGGGGAGVGQQQQQQQQQSPQQYRRQQDERRDRARARV
jgi:hypothetical protein